MNNLIDIKKAYETTEFLDELFDRFEITNSNGEFDEYFSEINPTSLKTKLYAPIAEAIIYTAMCQNEEVKNAEPIIGVGKISDVMIVSEYRSDDNTEIVSYSTDNTKRGRTCGSGKKYKQCHGK